MKNIGEIKYSEGMQIVSDLLMEEMQALAEMRVRAQKIKKYDLIENYRSRQKSLIPSFIMWMYFSIEMEENSALYQLSAYH